jgi:hypothetical protein
VRNPAAAVDAAGNLYVAWIGGSQAVDDGRAEIYFSYQTPSGAWAAGERIDDVEASTVHPDAAEPAVDQKKPGVFPRNTSLDWAITAPALTVDGQSNAYAIWTDSRDGIAEVYFAYRPAQGQWGRNVIVNDDAERPVPGSARIAVDLSGNAFAVWAGERSGQSDIYFAYRRAGGVWGPNVKVIDRPSDGRGSPEIVVDAESNAYALWQEFHDCSHGKLVLSDAYFAVRPTDGAWGRPEQVSTNGRTVDMARLALAVDPPGDVYVAWQEKQGGTYSLKSACRPRGVAAPGPGSWAPLSLLDESAASELPLMPALAAGARGNAYLGWVGDKDGARRVLLALAAVPDEPKKMVRELTGALSAQ